MAWRCRFFGHVWRYTRGMCGDPPWVFYVWRCDRCGVETDPEPISRPGSVVIMPDP